MEQSIRFPLLSFAVAVCRCLSAVSVVVVLPFVVVICRCRFAVKRPGLFLLKCGLETAYE
jgi:hypothetical protein